MAITLQRRRRNQGQHYYNNLADVALQHSTESDNHAQLPHRRDQLSPRASQHQQTANHQQTKVNFEQPLVYHSRLLAKERTVQGDCLH